jgi:carbonic anhydrase/acetyltransferase-like protein (isoleucine patch superfamily)
VLNGAKIGAECLIGSNALIPEGREIPPRSVVVGSPGKIVRQVNDKDLELIRWGVDFYVTKGPIYASRLKLQA